jgi:capsular polysaccharide biosynthesis protein
MQILDKPTIIPFAGTMDSFTGGVFSSDGRFMEDSLLHRGKPGHLRQSAEHLPGTYIYGGCLFDHFGHFIWESLSRLYTLREYREYPVLFITPDGGYGKFIKLLGVDNEIRLINAQTSVEKLLYSPPGSSLEPLYITDEQISALKYYHFNTNDKNLNRKIWLSRSRLLFGTVFNEPAIEKILAKIGYAIIYPETLSLPEQVKLISTADIVAGFDGSQFYSLLFAAELAGQFHIFNRRSEIPDAMQYVLQKRNAEFALYNFKVEYICGEGAAAYYMHSEPEKIIEALRNL